MTTRRAPRPLAVLGLVGLAAAPIALSQPLIVPGWPMPAPAGDLLTGPGGEGVVLVNGTLAAFRADGSRRWVSTRTPRCGNCDEGEQTVQRQGDGSTVRCASRATTSGACPRPVRS